MYTVGFLLSDYFMRALTSTMMKNGSLALLGGGENKGGGRSLEGEESIQDIFCWGLDLFLSFSAAVGYFCFMKSFSPNILPHHRPKKWSQLTITSEIMNQNKSSLLYNRFSLVFCSSEQLEGITRIQKLESNSYVRSLRRGEYLYLSIPFNLDINADWVVKKLGTPGCCHEF